MRTVTIRTADEFQNKIVGDKKLESAIGYLSTWGVGSPRYLTVTLFIDRDGNIDANYWDIGGNVNFTIGGIRQADGSYSFHS